MKSPSKVTCFSRPSQGKGGGVEVCRQGHALWLWDHYNLDQFNHWKESKKKVSMKLRPILILSPV